MAQKLSHLLVDEVHTTSTYVHQISENKIDIKIVALKNAKWSYLKFWSDAVTLNALNVPSIY